MEKPRFEPGMEISFEGRRGRIRRVADSALVVRFEGETFDRWLFLENIERLWEQGQVRLGPKPSLPRRWLWQMGIAHAV
jgi:hypothetical protein